MANALEKPTGEYRQYLPDLNLKRFQVMCQQDAHEYAHDFKTGHQPPWLHALYMHWLDLLQEPFKGVTTDGTSKPERYKNASNIYRNRPPGSIHITRRRHPNPTNRRRNRSRNGPVGR